MLRPRGSLSQSLMAVLWRVSVVPSGRLEKHGPRQFNHLEADDLWLELLDDVYLLAEEVSPFLSQMPWTLT